MLKVIQQIIEAARKHGLESLYGVRRENICTRDLGRYFRALGERLEAVGIYDLGTTDSAEAVSFVVAAKVGAVCRRLQPLLLQTLSVNLMAAMLEGDRTTVIEKRLIRATEGDGLYPNSALRDLAPSILTGATAIDQLGLSGIEAAEYAAQHAALLVRGIDETTVEMLRTVIERGIRDRLGNDAVARLIRREVLQMSTRRARLIAATEMNDAFSEASMRKMRRLKVEYKRLSIAAGACEKCRGIAAQGAVRVTTPFLGGKMRTPIHPSCRCATVAARPPL